MTDIIKLEVIGRVAKIVMDEGENRFNAESVAGHHKAMDAIEADDVIKAVVITGAHPKYFCNGLDLERLVALKPDELRKFIPSFALMLERWAIFPKPVVAAINGHAFAGGAMLAACTDFRIMNAKRGWLCTPEVDINLPFWPGMIALLKSGFPPGTWRDMALTGKRLTATELLEIGFLTEACEPEEVLPKSMALAEELADKNPAAYAEIKRRMKADIVKVMREQDSEYFPKVNF